MQADNESVRVHHGVLGLYSGVLYMGWGGGGDNLARASSDIRERSDLSLQEAYICLSCNAYAVTYMRGTVALVETVVRETIPISQ